MGGCFVRDKSAWYQVNYEWIQGKQKWTNPGQDKVPEATNKPSENPPLKHLHANESMSQLEIYLALDCNNKYQVIYMYKSQPPGQLK